MTEYKENVWYGWNGGECPVHMHSEVEIVWRCGPNDFISRSGIAGNIAFLGNDFGSVVAFRVVKPYREPRELWHLLDLNGEVFDTFTDRDVARYRANDCPGFTLVHYREVTESGDA